MSNASYVVRLNNYLQGLSPSGVVGLSWQELRDGVAPSEQWTMTCKFHGVAKGSARASTKSAAKEEAARQALVVFGQI